MEGKSIDLASNDSNDLNFDQYLKNREKKVNTKTAKSQHLSDSKSMRPPQKMMGRIAPYQEFGDMTNVSNIDYEKDSIEPLSLSKISKKDGLKSQKSQRSNKSNPPEVKKASGVEVSIVTEENLLPPRDEFIYKSRNEKRFDDEKSTCSVEIEDEVWMVLEHGISQVSGIVVAEDECRSQGHRIWSTSCHIDSISPKPFLKEFSIWAVEGEM